MEIKKNYYTEDKQLWEQIYREIADRQSTMLGEKLASEHERLRREADEMIQGFLEKQGTVYKIVSLTKLARFSALAKAADSIAQIESLDIHAFTTEQIGKIRLTGEDFILTSTHNMEQKYLFSSLLLFSDDSFISVKDGLLEMEFIFNLCDTIESN